MKLLIISDVHGNWPALRTVLEAEPDADRTLCLGDLVGYGPQPFECVAWAKENLPPEWINSKVYDYVLQRVRQTREHPGVLLGASPRGSLGLVRLSQAMAAIRGEDQVSIPQVDALVEVVLGHRLIVRPERKHRWHEGADVIRDILAGKKPD